LTADHADTKDRAGRACVADRPRMPKQETTRALWRGRRQEEVRVLVSTAEGVLLLKRPYPPVWEMPGGAIEPGESPAEAALRETAEETGLQVELTGLLGTFRRSGWLGGTVYLFSARPVGGQLTVNPAEAQHLAFFPPHFATRLMLPWHRPYWARVAAQPTAEVTPQHVRTADVLLMLALTAAYHLGLLRDPEREPPA
jgi:8-oxo-dGTP pyrophosphatase MutT (NUDIX family)